VRLRLRSDVPVGTCLSGGLDSSSIVGLAAQATPHPVRTFTAVYDDPGYDERRFARAVVERFGCLPHEVTPSPGEGLVPLLDRIGWFHDEPCARPGLVTQWYVMSRAAGVVKVLLDGQGGDELLLGYAYYALPYLRSLLAEAWRARRPGDLQALWRDARGLLASPSTSSGGTGALAAHLLRAALARVRPRGPRHDPGLVAAAAALPRPVDDAPPGTAPIDRLLRRDLTATSIPALLHHEDRTSMAFSLEARVPFLDWRVAELALSIDYREKVRGGLLKQVLRDAMRDLLPAEVLARTDKLGYPTPVGRWLREGGPAVREKLLGGFAPRGLVARADVERAWQAHEAGRGDPWRLYRWLTAELWLGRMI
jgi:asparagine synthase (glutamine-hydrolysing)